MPTATTALIPLRSPGRGKTRLAPVLSPAQRAALAGAMLADVAAALARAAVDEIVVVAGGPEAAAAASTLGLEVLLDPPSVTSLDAALAHAALTLGPRPALLVVAADLPVVAPADLDAVLDHDAEVVIAPTRDGGTGALLRRPSDAIPTAYGRASARRHGRAAAARGRSCGLVHRDGLAHDIDTVADLRALTGLRVGPATSRVLPGLLPPVVDGRDRTG